MALFGMKLAAVHGQTSNPQTLDKLYPYVVTSDYIAYDKLGADSVNWALGNGLYVALVFEDHDRVSNVKRADLKNLGIDIEKAKQRSIENLQSLFKSGVVKAARFVGPEQKPFILMGGHWASATCILLPDLQVLGSKNLGTEKFLVCIPHREALLMFPVGESSYRESMLKIIQEKESDGRKPFSFSFFEVGPNGITEFKQ